MRTGLAAGLAVTLALTGGSGTALAGNASIGTRGTATSNTFVPGEVTVDPGSSVTVTNTNNGPAIGHDLMWDDGAPGAPVSASMWTSTRMFTVPGDYRFFCSVHGAAGGVGMAGVVHVIAPPPPAVTPPAAVPVVPAPQVADTTAPGLVARAKATRRRVSVRVTLGEAAGVTLVVQRGRRVVARRVFPARPPGRSDLAVAVRSKRGRLSVRVSAVDAAGNTSSKTLRVKVS